MANLDQYFMEFSPLEEEVLATLLQSTTTRIYNKGEYLLQAGSTCKYLYFINEGLAKSFFRRKDFGLNFHMLNEAGDIVVGEEVKLIADIEMFRQ